MYFEIEKQAIDAINKALDQYDVEVDRNFKLEFPPNPNLGDLASTIAFALTKKLRTSPHAVGVGSCWIHRAREEFASDKGKELLKEWGIPETYEGIGHVVLGYPDMDAPKPLPRKEDYIHYVD